MVEWVPAFLLSFGVIFVAELGDKSQLMALTFAVRYRPWPVLAGITLATSLVHAVSVAVGYGLGAALPTQWILLAGGLAFFGFAAWTLRGDELSEADSGRANRTTRSAVIAVTGAFFLAELGDKTMLATITLATHHGWFGTWLGSTVGMVVADALAILVGRVLGRQLPEHTVRFGASALFVLFGGWLLIDAAGQFAQAGRWEATGHHIAGWVAFGVAVLGIIAGWLVRTRAPKVQGGRGPGPYRVPARRRGGTGRLAGVLLWSSVLLGLASSVLVAADVVQPIRPLSAPGWAVLGAGVMLLGVALLLAAQVGLGRVRREWRDGRTEARLVTGGVYSRVRNPGLTGIVVLMAGTLFMAPTPLAVLATLLLLVAVQVQARAVREPTLEGLFGADYQRYRRRTGRFLPRIGQR